MLQQDYPLNAFFVQKFTSRIEALEIEHKKKNGLAKNPSLKLSGQKRSIRQNWDEIFRLAKKEIQELKSVHGSIRLLRKHSPRTEFNKFCISCYRMEVTMIIEAVKTN